MERRFTELFSRKSSDSLMALFVMSMACLMGLVLAVPLALAEQLKPDLRAQGLTTLTSSKEASIAEVKITLYSDEDYDPDYSDSDGELHYVYDGNAKEPGVSVTLEEGYYVVDNSYVVIDDQNSEYRLNPDWRFDDDGIGHFGYYDDESVWHDVRSLEHELQEGVDYKVTYLNNINAGQASVRIDGIGYWTGTMTKCFTITPLTLEDGEYDYDDMLDSDGNSTLTIEGYPFEKDSEDGSGGNYVEDGPLQYTTYNASAKTPAITVMVGLSNEGRTLKNGVDYTVGYKNNVDVGVATVEVTGKGNYSGTLTKRFRIIKANVKKASITGLKNAVYTGKPITPSLSVMLGGATLVKDKDYVISFEDNVDVGTATVTITGRKNCKGTLNATFKVLPLGNLSKAIVSGIVDKKYNGKKQTQSPVVKIGDIRLVKGRDYALSYSGNKAAGTAKVVIEGMGGYVGTTSRSFKITASLRDASSVKVKDAHYTGKGVKPALTIIAGGRKLVKGKDYTVSCKNNVRPGKATAVIQGKGAITGSIKRGFRVIGAMKDAKIGPITAKVYTGKKMMPRPVVKFGKAKLKYGRDYTLSYKNNVKAGKATVVVTGMGKYDGAKTKSFTIKRANIKKAKVSSISDQQYRNDPVYPEPSVKYAGKVLKLGRDYQLEYSGNNKCGVAKVTVIGMGSFTGSTSRSFKVIGDISNAFVRVKSLIVSNGSPLTPEPYVSLYGRDLKPNRDYIVTYKNNVDAGTATVIVTGAGYYVGSKKETFKIVQGGEGETVTLAEFNRIKLGMTYKQVADIIGGDGELVSEYSGYNTHHKTYRWDADANWGSASVAFTDGQVSSKHQYGL